MRTVGLLLAVASWLASGPAGAEPTAADAPAAPLTEAEAVRLALEESRQLASLDTDIEIAVHRQDSNRWLNNPMLRIDEMTVQHAKDGLLLRDEVEVGLRWRPPALGERAEEAQRATVREWQGRVRADRARRRLVSRVRRAYAGVVLFDALDGLATRRVQVETARVGLVDKMKDLGQRSIVYATKAKMWVANAKTTQERVRRRRRAARRRLARLTGAADTVAVVAADPPAVVAPVEELATTALAGRPEQRLVEARTRLAAREHDREWYELLPWLSFVQVSTHLQAARDTRTELMLGIELPLLNHNRGNIEATRLAIERKATRAEALGERIELAVRDTLAAYEEARQDWERTRADAHRLVTSARAVIEEANRHRTVPADEVWELERTIVDSQELVHDKRHRTALAGIDLCEALGVESLAVLQDAGGGGGR